MSPRPFFRAFDGWWYVQLRVDGKRRQIKLAKGKRNRAAAEAKWHDLLASGTPSPVTLDPAAVLVLLDRFLDHCLHESAEATYGWYRYFFRDFKAWLVSKGAVQLALSEFGPAQVTEWLTARTSWSKSTKNGAVRAIRRAFRWLHELGYIDKYPLATLKAPSRGRREIIVSPGQFSKLLEAATDDQFRDLLSFLHWTGCRPQEACHVEARHVEIKLSRIVFPPSESKGKEYPRVIYLNDQALSLIDRLSKRWPNGKLFRNRRHSPWNRNAVRCRFRRLRSKVGHFCAYHLRHTFATEALQHLDAFTVSVLMGHADVSTLARQYQHLAKAPGFLQEAIRKARDA